MKMQPSRSPRKEIDFQSFIDTDPLMRRRVCGTQFYVGENPDVDQRTATIGGCVIINNFYYGVTVLHPFLAPKVNENTEAAVDRYAGLGKGAVERWLDRLPVDPEEQRRAMKNTEPPPARCRERNNPTGNQGIVLGPSGTDFTTIVSWSAPAESGALDSLRPDVGSLDNREPGIPQRDPNLPHLELEELEAPGFYSTRVYTVHGERIGEIPTLPDSPRPDPRFYSLQKNWALVGLYDQTPLSNWAGQPTEAEKVVRVRRFATGAATVPLLAIVNEETILPTTLRGPEVVDVPQMGHHPAYALLERVWPFNCGTWIVGKKEEAVFAIIVSPSSQSRSAYALRASEVIVDIESRFPDSRPILMVERLRWR
ncbi:uncharacterized protein BO97DRAFT_413360 [Aspergillus homomorphus CBS 101889]|uniref:Uncharacterized protein n=1 Tax=Aspergillus homomorphus (strain CBS 101889) TaxID=1450537 RepID=A0A395I0W5_ASPHC|nr:hypothetical protein BO97DRAFT_413360 [Aspergillus homomorphus CBS 101889]RAL13365.1 hypothetical protein BO97DRAFT_413360 [Aspergillus homomorphus CBS 101889]